MKIACLQFAPHPETIETNIEAAESVLASATPEDLQGLDLLVLPELALSGYNYRSLSHIYEYLEPTANGITAQWARQKATKYDCFVVAGYPESVDNTAKWPADPEYYNSVVAFDPEGNVAANYRKSHLYYADETWALQGAGFLGRRIGGLGNCAMGICMDINPYKFLASEWHEYEFANHVLDCKAELVILSMAWLTREDAESFLVHPAAPDKDTLTYWIQRLGPLVVADRDYEIVVVIANRCGTEEEAVYAGTSTVLSIFQKKVKLYGILGRGTSELLVVDTNSKPRGRIVLPPDLLTFASARRMDPEAEDNEIQSVPQFGISSTVSTNINTGSGPTSEHNSNLQNDRLSSSTVFEDISVYHDVARGVDHDPE